MKITADMLREKGACSDQVEKFERLWPDGVVPTLELAEKHASDFDFNFAAEKFLSPPALAEYKRVEAPARAEYKRVMAPARAEVDRVMAQSWDEYVRVTKQAWDEYKRVIAATFVRLYLERKGKA